MKLGNLSINYSFYEEITEESQLCDFEMLYLNKDVETEDPIPFF